MFRLAFALFSPVLALLAIRFFLRPLGLPRWVFRPLVALWLLAASKFIFFALVGGDTFNPEFPRALLILWNTADAIAICFSLLGIGAFLISRFLSLLSRFLNNPKPESRNLNLQPLTFNLPTSARRWLACIFLLLSCAVGVRAVYESVTPPRVTRYELDFPDLPAEFDGYRIVHLSDLHVSTFFRRPQIEAIVQQVAALQPDLICITGDFVDGLVERRGEDLAPLRKLRARDGVYGVAGNHEFYWDWASWRQFLSAQGVKILQNESVRILRGEAALQLAGLDDHMAWGCPEEKAAGSEGPRLDAAFATGEMSDFRILLYHHPIWSQLAAEWYRVRLQLSGHTHGGAMPGLRSLVSAHNEGHVAGVYREGKATLCVSRGTGQWAGFPYRLGDPTEIIELYLRRGTR